MKTTLIIVIICLLSFHSSAQKERYILFETKYEITSHDTTDRLKFTAALAQDMEGRQKVDTIYFNKTPVRIFEEGGNKYAEFVYDKSLQKATLKIFTIMTIYKSDLNTIQKNLKKNPGISLTTPSEIFLQSEKYMECDDEAIIQIAKKLHGKTPLKTAKNIYNYVQKNITYNGYNPGDVGAREVIVCKKGDCTEFTDLFVTLCRACSIPAKHIFGNTATNCDMPKHSWAEAFFEGIGWVPFEITLGHESTFNSKQNNYIYLSDNRNNPILNYAFTHAWTYWGSPVSVKETYDVKEFKKQLNL